MRLGNNDISTTKSVKKTRCNLFQELEFLTEALRLGQMLTLTAIKLNAELTQQEYILCLKPQINLKLTENSLKNFEPICSLYMCD